MQILLQPRTFNSGWIGLLLCQSTVRVSLMHLVTMCSLRKPVWIPQHQHRNGLFSPPHPNSSVLFKIGELKLLTAGRSHENFPVMETWLEDRSFTSFFVQPVANSTKIPKMTWDGWSPSLFIATQERFCTSRALLIPSLTFLVSQSTCWDIGAHSMNI